MADAIVDLVYQQRHADFQGAATLPGYCRALS
jgi:hypothetical protein